MFRKLIGLSLAMMLGFGTVGCMSTQEEQQPQQEYVEQQPQDEYKEYKQEDKYTQEQPQDEDVSDYYLENRQKTDLEKAKETIEVYLRENGLDSALKVAIDEQNNRLYIVGVSNSEEVANLINENQWYIFIDFGKMITSQVHQEFGVDVAFVIVTSDVEQCYLSIFNGEVMFDVEEELEKRGY